MGAFVISDLRTKPVSKRKPFNLPDKEFQFWKPIGLNGKNYSFDHLNAVKRKFQHPEREEYYVVYITISHHVFTVDLEKADDSHSFQYPYKREDPRYFCEKRYELSFNLPKILEELPSLHCYHGGYGRYCICQFDDGNGNKIYYQVVFRTWRAQKKLRLHVESAYPLPGHPGKTKKVSFWVVFFTCVVYAVQR